MPASAQVSFNVPLADAEMIEQIVDRAVAELPGVDRLGALMDLTATHANGTPLKLAKLLAFDRHNLAHDIYGIERHLDRKTGKLTDHFLPRCAR